MWALQPPSLCHFAWMLTFFNPFRFWALLDNRQIWKPRPVWLIVVHQQNANHGHQTTVELSMLTITSAAVSTHMPNNTPHCEMQTENCSFLPHTYFSTPHFYRHWVSSTALPESSNLQWTSSYTAVLLFCIFAQKEVVFDWKCTSPVRAVHVYTSIESHIITRYARRKRRESKGRTSEPK